MVQTSEDSLAITVHAHTSARKLDGSVCNCLYWNQRDRSATASFCCSTEEMIRAILEFTWAWVDVGYIFWIAVLASSIFRCDTNWCGEWGHLGKRAAKMIGGTPPMAIIYLQPWLTCVKPAPREYEISWPNVTLTLSRAIMRPRYFAGAISPI